MSLAKYSLNIYERGTFEVLETLESNGLLWGDYVDIVEKSQKLKEKTDDATLMENFDLVQETMMIVFPDLTEKKIRQASADEMMATFRQIIALGMRFKGKKNGKGDSKN